MDKKLIKAFTQLNNAIDAELDKSYIKLSDRFHNLELSHNRKKFALLKLGQFFTSVKHDIEYTGNAYSSLADVNEALKIINDALFCDGRVNSSLVQRKK